MDVSAFDMRVTSRFDTTTGHRQWLITFTQHGQPVNFRETELLHIPAGTSALHPDDALLATALLRKGRAVGIWCFQMADLTAFLNQIYPAMTSAEVAA